MVLFEIATFLVISHASARSHHDAHRFEKISNIIKQFKLSCNKMGSQFQTMEVFYFFFSFYFFFLLSFFSSFFLSVFFFFFRLDTWPNFSLLS